MARVLVVQNSPSSGLRRFGEWWREDGLELDVRHGADGLPQTLDGYDALVLLGGGYLPSDDGRAPWLPAERALTGEALDAAIPVLGICLGGQLLASVAGGAVEGRHGRPERGSTTIEATDASAGDALFAGIPRQISMIENHEDSITALPAGAVLLASSADHPNQAFRVGGSAWGLQFHPEVGAADLAAWKEAALAADGLDLAAVRAAANEAEPAAASVARVLAANFATAVTAR
ncbi:type 1 glutamine amidotransferase [Gryllotalpicola protaetiae]|uniref:Type 1 glutamine amidotransferase n=1 Tax=Gryllotalpicola protaetiae TaxID=2419771 RepID=A0A387BJ46_9MICO|nr:type 1 glutamine amidotransferase [Gryllotalpicola protaetiae]AYG04115.1 type 1 glutamine amidotransferase [Gryllotalpicola protaetiae]